MFCGYWKRCWDIRVTVSPFWQLHKKLKRLRETLNTFSKKEYGDIFAKFNEFKESIKKAEEEFLSHKTYTDKQELQRLNANYIRYLTLEDSILIQKTQI